MSTMKAEVKSKPAKKKRPKRKGLGKKIRFEVFKRDSFKCQYCGKSAPDVILNVDHISPVSKGGKNDVMNLTTSCKDCNSGKSDRLLDDDSVIAKQRAQLEELNQRREQLGLMLKWRDAVSAIGDDTWDALHAHWRKRTGYGLNASGEGKSRKLIRDFGLKAILDAIDTAASQYLKFGEDGVALQDSVEVAFSKISGIAFLDKNGKTDKDLYHARGILRNRLPYCSDWKSIKYLREARSKGASGEELKDLAKSAYNWTEFCSTLREEWGVDA